MSPPAAIRTVIADDEAPGRRTLRLLLGSDPEITIVAECASGPETLAALRAEHPDLVFLDVWSSTTATPSGSQRRSRRT